MPKTLATATVDRLLRHAHVCQTTGDSVRLTLALTGTRGEPLDLDPPGAEVATYWADPMATTGQLS